jgi:hypothetical protein
MEIIDNFVHQEKFDELQDLILGANFSWYYNSMIDYAEDVDKFQFIHGFYTNHSPCSPYFHNLNPVLEIINPISLWRIKANLLTITPNIVENDFHIDMGGISNEKLNQLTTAIFYLNTNNGYTEFQDGRIAMENTKVKSVANRLVTFPASLRHRGTSCTDEKNRVVINFDYFKG